MNLKILLVVVKAKVKFFGQLFRKFEQGRGFASSSLHILCHPFPQIF